MQDEDPAFETSRLVDQPSQGPEDAALQIVLAADFECSLCRSIAHTAERLQARWPGQILLTFVNAPLCTDCNPSVGQNLHPDACRLAELGEAAHEQGLFWEYHRLIYDEMDPPDVGRDAVAARLGEIGIDRAQLEASLADGAASRAVLDDIAFCTEVGMTTTPSLAFNGYVKRGSMFPWMLEEIVAAVLGERP